MKRLYLRWIGIGSVVFLLALLGARRYCNDVATLPIERLVAEAPSGEVRVLGQIVANSIVPSEEGMSFQLTDPPEALTVLYTGKETDEIRDLKTLVMIGKWDGGTRRFIADRTAIRPNYGFVLAAYLVGLIPVALFLFRMEYRVARLYAEIKETKVYEVDTP
jgi:cytochrome c-type biogenesis protein CcmE